MKIPATAYAFAALTEQKTVGHYTITSATSLLALLVVSPVKVDADRATRSRAHQ
jgi:hypothetical protein